MSLFVNLFTSFATLVGITLIISFSSVFYMSYWGAVIISVTDASISSCTAIFGPDHCGDREIIQRVAMIAWWPGSFIFLIYALFLVYKNFNNITNEKIEIK